VAPEIELDGDGAVVFKPTAVGTVSARTLVLRNHARVDAAFRWRVPQTLAGRLSFAPPEGVLRGGDACAVTVTFAPQAPGMLSAQVPLYVRPAGAPMASERKAAYAAVRGEARPGAVTIEPGDALDFGAVLVGAPAARTLTVRNTSDCNMCFVLLPSEAEPEGTALEAEGAGPLPAGLALQPLPPAAAPQLDVSPSRGVVPARGSITVNAVLRMAQPGTAAVRGCAVLPLCLACELTCVALPCSSSLGCMSRPALRTCR
jgi:hypothetical protein